MMAVVITWPRNYLRSDLVVIWVMQVATGITMIVSSPSEKRVISWRCNHCHPMNSVIGGTLDWNSFGDSGWSNGRGAHAVTMDGGSTIDATIVNCSLVKTRHCLALHPLRGLCVMSIASELDELPLCRRRRGVCDWL